MSANIPTGEKPEEIEVTDDMVRAGADIIGNFDPEFVTARQLAEAVYRAMELQRRCRAPS